MRTIFLYFTLSTIIFVVNGDITSDFTPEVQDLWRNYKINHTKQFRSLYDEHIHKLTFQKNLEKIEEHNAKYFAGLVSYKIGINKFTDMPKDELKQYLRLKMSGENNDEYFEVPFGVNISKEIDWRAKGAVTEIKNQMSCGSCWSFSVTGSIEGQMYIRNGQLISLSEQNLIDCAGGDYGNMGCSGGFLDTAFKYVQDYGLEPEMKYPYEAKDDTCRFNSSETVVKISKYLRVEPNNEEALVAAVGLIGPVSIAVDASNWFAYEDGIFDDPMCSTMYLNHGVLAVGYGTTKSGQDYWIVKNSWGPTFGENGFIRVKRGINQCGIALEPIFPVL